jgi:hypothetical protein
LKAINSVGIELDDGNREAKARRRAERAGLSRVKKSLIAVSLPVDEGLRLHPIWLQIQGALAKSGTHDAVVLESTFDSGQEQTCAPWSFPSSEQSIEPPQPRRLLWKLPAELIKDRARSSASELSMRLACPVSWVFSYVAKLHSSPIARLPDDFALKGTFCHAVLESVFQKGIEFSNSERIVEEVTRTFDERLPLDAAPLAQPTRLSEKLQLRHELQGAARTLSQVLAAGQYQVVGMELEVKGAFEGRPLTGAIDCIVEGKDGTESVIDFKYGGRRKYGGLLSEGRATQLATYAHARETLNNKRVSAVGYLILSQGVMLTPKGSALEGGSSVQVVDGPSIQDVWNAFSSALRGAEGWLRGEDAVPARPLQDPDAWPDGATLVLEGPDSKGRMPQEQPTCKYCDYQILCGRKELA